MGVWVYEGWGVVSPSEVSVVMMGGVLCVGM